MMWLPSENTEKLFRKYEELKANGAPKEELDEALRLYDEEVSKELKETKLPFEY